MENLIRNNKLKIEIKNPVYDVFDETIKYMANKKKYTEEDTVKLCLAIYKKMFEYVTKDNGYRDQLMLLSDYFRKEYNHELICLILIKNIVNNDHEKDLSKIIKNPDMKDQVLFLAVKEEYNDLLELIENDEKIFIALAKVYAKNED